MSRRVNFALGIIFAVLISAPSFAADDESLVRVLTSADIAQDFAFYCAQYDPSIMERTKSSVGDAQSLMLHVRSEVVSGLPRSEAAQIVLHAANIARAGALLAVRKLYGSNRQEEHARIADWCERSVVPSINKFVELHDEHHAVIDELIQKAKQKGSRGSSTQAK